jgi:hypothetical protein
MRSEYIASLVLYVATAVFAIHGYSYFVYQWEIFSNTDRAGSTKVGKHNNASPTTKPNLCILSTVLSLDGVHEHVWESLGEWCRESKTDIFVVYKMGQIPKQHSSALLQHCNLVHLELQPTTVPANRIDRIAMLRNLAKQLPLAAGKEQSAYLAAVVLDMDVEILPNWKEMHQALHQMKHDDQEYDILCCNGYENFSGMKQAYDLYPLVMNDGRWPFDELGSLYWYLTLQQPRLYQQIRSAQYHSGTEKGMFEVRSCFGGLAFYKPDTYFDTQCMYDTYPTSLSKYADSNGKVCEHLVLHECLHASSSSTLKVGIAPNLPLQRTCGGACPLVPYIYLLFLTVLVATWSVRGIQRIVSAPKNRKRRIRFSSTRRIAEICACALILIVYTAIVIWMTMV